VDRVGKGLKDANDENDENDLKRGLGWSDLQCKDLGSMLWGPFGACYVLEFFVTPVEINGSGIWKVLAGAAGVA
jgi:hypothetical protein